MQLRDFWALLLTILSAPFFILIYFLMTGGSSTTYNIQYQYVDTIDAVNIRNQLVTELKAVKYADAKSALNVFEASDTASVKNLIKNRKVDLFLLIPSGFADSLKSGNTPQFTVFGDASNPKYSIATIFTITGIESFIKKQSRNKPLYNFQEKLMGNSNTKSEFDIYAPGIFIFSIIMLILSASLSIIRDVEDKTMIRLKLTRMTVFDYLLGNTIVQWIIGVLSFRPDNLAGCSSRFQQPGFYLSYSACLFPYNSFNYCNFTHSCRILHECNNDYDCWEFPVIYTHVLYRINDTASQKRNFCRFCAERHITTNTCSYCNE